MKEIPLQMTSKENKNQSDNFATYKDGSITTRCAIQCDANCKSHN